MTLKKKRRLKRCHVWWRQSASSSVCFNDSQKEEKTESRGDLGLTHIRQVSEVSMTLKKRKLKGIDYFVYVAIWRSLVSMTLKRKRRLKQHSLHLYLVLYTNLVSMTLKKEEKTETTRSSDNTSPIDRKLGFVSMTLKKKRRLKVEIPH